MQNLKITLIQTEMHWENIEANLAMFEEKIWQISHDTDVIILPEMFQTGFTMNAAELAEPENFRTFRWMKQMASARSCVITGSFIVKSNESYFNRLYWVFPDGEVEFYDKRHLFRFANEDETYSGGC
jgi:predicted amidohydrolase